MSLLFRKIDISLGIQDNYDWEPLPLAPENGHGQE